MRITNRLLVDKVLANIQRNTEQLSKYQDQVATGRRIDRPSDDPSGTVTSLVLHSADDQNAQEQTNLDLANTWLNSTDTALQDVNSILQRARELAVQGANETLSQQETNALGNELDQLIDHAMQLANTRSGDRYIFGGFSTLSKPFQFNQQNLPLKERVDYLGDNGEILRAVAPGVKIAVNVSGDRVFPQLFEALIALRDDLRTHDQGSISNTRLDELDNVYNSVLDVLGEVGAKGSRLELTKRQLSATRLDSADLISKTEDVDMSDAIIHLSAQQASLQASLAAGARVIQPQLLDFLR